MQAVLPFPIEYQPEPMSFCPEQPKWERSAIIRNWFAHSLHPKAVQDRKHMAAMKAYYAQFTPEMIAEHQRKYEEAAYQRKIESGLVRDCPPKDAVAFWFDRRLGLEKAKELRLGRWINRVQYEGLVRRGTSLEFFEMR